MLIHFLQKQMVNAMRDMRMREHNWFQATEINLLFPIEVNQEQNIFFRKNFVTF